MSRAPGFSYGTPGGGLTNASWAANADVAAIGQRGEIKTARILDALARTPGGPTVLHDLMIPGYRANVDHVVVSGKTVTIIDTKVWAPGFFWTLSGRTRRGWAPFPAGDKRTMRLALKQLQAHLDTAGRGATFKTPVVAVWPSRPTPRSNYMFMSMPGARVLPVSVFERRVSSIVGHKNADPHIVTALLPLLSV